MIWQRKEGEVLEKPPIEAQLRELIVSRYGDVKSFSMQANIPNSTISTIFKRGINKANIGNIIALATALSISVDGLADGEIRPAVLASDVDPLKTALLSSFDHLNGEGRELLVGYADTLVASGKYIKTHSAGLGGAQA